MNGARPVIVRPRGGRLPRSGRFIAPIIRDAEEVQSIIVPQVEMLAWERLDSARHFFRNFKDAPGFQAWQRDARPLTKVMAFADMVQFPYFKAAPDEDEAPEAEAAPAPAPVPRRRTPTQDAVMLGRHEDGGEVYWAPFETEAKLLNFGILITGDPGSGKTQALNVLIEGVAKMGFPVCIFDFKNDYAERDFVRAIGLKVHDVRRHGIPFNPLMPSASEDGQAQPIEHIFTITGVLKRVFGLGDRQTATLRDAMKEAFERRGINPQKWVHADSIRPPSFDDVVAILEEQKEAKNPQAISLLDRIAALFELGLFPKSDELPVPFEAMLDERMVLSLFALPTDEIKAALAELIIIRLHGVLLRRAQPRRLTRLLGAGRSLARGQQHASRKPRARGPRLRGGHRHRHAISGRFAARSFRRARHQDLPQEPAAGSQEGRGARALRRQFRAGGGEPAWRSGAPHPVRGPDPEPAIFALFAVQAAAILRARGAADEGGVNRRPLSHGERDRVRGDLLL